MQAFILTCLLCLQTQFPCDSNLPSSPFENPSCSQCLNGLSDHFNLTNSPDINQAFKGNLADTSRLTQSSISPDLKENLEGIFADTKKIVQEIKGVSDDIHGLINKIKSSMNQALVASVPDHDGTFISIPSEQSSLEKLVERLSQFVDGNDALQKMLKIMQETVLNKEGGEKRDSLRKGDRLMIGESLYSHNGKYRWTIELGTADWVIYDEEGKEVKRMDQSGTFMKPVGTNIHVVMNHSLESYWDLWQGKSANPAGAYGIPLPCVGQYSDCYAKFDNDGHLKLFTSNGEVVDTFM